MKKIKQLILISLWIANISTINACNNTNTANVQANAIKNVFQKVQQQKPSVVQASLDKAKKEGKVVFVVVTSKSSTGNDKATAIAKGATAKYKNAIIVQLDRDNLANANLITLFRLTGAPLPLILVVSPKGNAVGGFILNEANSDKLIELIPSPKLDDIYVAANSGTPVFLIVSKANYTDRLKLLGNCKAAKTQLKNKVSIIEIDLADAKEQKFIKQLNLKTTANKSTVLVLNTTGQVTGTFEGNADITQLTQAATKVNKGGCNSSCGPACTTK